MEVICVVSLFALLSSWEAEDGWKWYVHCEFVCSLVFCARPFLFIWKKRQIDLTVAKLGKQKMEVIWIVWVCLHSFGCCCGSLRKRMVCRSANVVLWAGLLFFKFVCVFGRLCMYLEDPLLPVHLNEEPDLVDGFEAWESKDALHCEFVCSLCLFLWKKPFVPHSPSLA